MSETPKSDAAIAEAQEFVAICLARMENGKKEYGDSSFDSSHSQGIEEIQQELLDTAVWSYIEWRKLNRLKARIRKLENSLGSLEDTLP